MRKKSTRYVAAESFQTQTCHKFNTYIGQPPCNVGGPTSLDQAAYLQVWMRCFTMDVGAGNEQKIGVNCVPLQSDEVIMARYTGKLYCQRMGSNRQAWKHNLLVIFFCCKQLWVSRCCASSNPKSFLWQESIQSLLHWIVHQLHKKVYIRTFSPLG